MLKSQTLSQPFVVEGIGLHTGEVSRVTVMPATSPRGRIFLIDGVEILAVAENVTDTRRCTTLGYLQKSISTVEHLLAALMLANIDHVTIMVEGKELPALDGSAKQWMDEIKHAGIITMDEPCETIGISAPFWLEDGECQSYVMPSVELAVYAALDVPDTVARHCFVGGNMADMQIIEQTVRARTFGLEREVRALLESGLAQGGSLANAVILTETGYLNDLVWPDEPVWHKVLDLMGDLALIGARLQGSVIAVRAGHRHNVATAGEIRRRWQQRSNL